MKKIEKIKLRWENGFGTEEGTIYTAIYWLEIDGIKFPVKEENVIAVGKKYAITGQGPILTYRGPKARQACIELAELEKLKVVFYEVLQGVEKGDHLDMDVDSYFKTYEEAFNRFEDIKEEADGWCGHSLVTCIQESVYKFDASGIYKNVDCCWEYDAENEENMNNILESHEEYI